MTHEVDTPTGTIEKHRGDLPEAKKSKKRVRYSNFFITINTNQSYTGHEENYEKVVAAFESSIIDVFAAEHIGNFMKDNETVWDKDHVKKYEVNFATERSSKGLLHAHILINIHHYTKVKIDTDKIKAAIMKANGLGGLYLNYKLFNNSKAVFEEYLTKYSAK